MARSAAAAVAAALAGSLLATASAYALVLRPVADSRGPGPVADDGALRYVGYAANASFQVVYRAEFLDAEGKVESEGLYLRDGAATLTVAEAGGVADAPGRGFAPFDGQPVFSAPAIGAEGLVAFAARYVEGGGAPAWGLFTHDGQDLRLALAAGAAVPGLADTFDRYGAPAVAAGGALAFTGYFNPFNDGLYGRADGVFVLDGDTLAAVAVENDSTPDGRNFVTFGTPRAAGARIAFHAGLDAGPGVDEGLYVLEQGALSLLLRPEGLAPGTGGAAFTALRGEEFDLDPAGGVVFAACYGDCLFSRGVFRLDALGVESIAVFNLSDPFDSFAGAGMPTVGATGAVGFTGARLASFSAGVWRREGGGLASVAIAGSPIGGPDLETHETLGPPVDDGEGNLVFSSVSNLGRARLLFARPTFTGPRGDVNLDGLVGPDDAYIILRISLGGAAVALSDHQEGQADADESGTVAAGDAVVTLLAAGTNPPQPLPFGQGERP